MRNQPNGRKTGAIGLAVGAGAALVLAGCGSNSSSTPASTTPAPVTPVTPATPATSGIPGPPSGATAKGSAQQVSGGATYAAYQTSASPDSVETYYASALKSSGYTITSQGNGSGGWKQYGGAEAGLSANNSSTYVEVNAGGSKQGPTYFEVCSGPSASSVSNCQSGNHGQTQQS